MLKWLLRLLKLHKLSRCRMALNCSCVFSHLIFGMHPVFPYWCRDLIFGATCRAILQCFRASWVCSYYPCNNIQYGFLCIYISIYVCVLYVITVVTHCFLCFAIHVLMLPQCVAPLCISRN
jgi:hypothetical protein